MAESPWERCMREGVVHGVKTVVAFLVDYVATWTRVLFTLRSSWNSQSVWDPYKPLCCVLLSIRCENLQESNVFIIIKQKNITNDEQQHLSRTSEREKNQCCSASGHVWRKLPWKQSFALPYIKSASSSSSSATAPTLHSLDDFIYCRYSSV